ncbi:Uncharacterised protein [Bifidobacterium longum subsp. infantis]|uniref:LPXTG cell wall anchor domain-containing protein n=2 Tax=Bifidobacterium longum subsp. infantis TaxID=1682 RepID=A0ABM9R646_BIFLI|nr:hypothetical protein Blon_1734 [Bifidobacterium longum subsp. infantis ATCC 15697 = JCM 1222 = DSM 20088]CEE99758.1 hypothetical protein BLIC_a01891 [Bifidobacterium longum subsp. infantis]CEF02658.1 hypothetical protein BLIC_b01902 [Bifidobacterium longum subsp. infantis]CEF04044.1 hypothetical protein BLIC_c01902 [Bifidobacterium longum subsp. infantis]CEF08803.1 hypothetical protein BLIC_e01915 [Bifidobacterium longum subsp. infantis]
MNSYLRLLTLGLSLFGVDVMMIGGAVVVFLAVAVAILIITRRRRTI